MQDKRNIEGYIETLCIPLAGQDIVLAVNPAAAEPYLVCSINYNNPLGLEERRDGMVSADYLEAMRELLRRACGLVDSLQTERAATGLPAQIMTTADCMPDSHDFDWEGRIIIVKPEALAPEYRRAENQIYKCVGGFGAKANARGTKVYAKELWGGEECCFQRQQIAGLADIAKLPTWAREKLRKPSLAEKLAEAKTEADAHNAAHPGKSKEREV